ncbi:SMC family ATPase [Priestia filamentosa]|uniref:AAA family ATPase n=1 Tax=Priestia filamentosa TaxID=1402861 RepID=UPI0005894ACF
MLIARLEVSYYRQFENQVIFFPFDGLIGLRGVNGAGKSTIFNVIDWVLWGKYKGVNQKEKLKMHKTPKNVPTFGVIDFVFNGDCYRVRRDLVNSKTRNYVEKNKNRVATGTTQVNSYIHSLFNMDQDTFRVCYYASQFDFDALTQMNDAPRAAMISKLLQIETIDETAKQARDDRKQYEIEISEAKRHLKDEEVLHNTLTEYKTTEQELQKELDALDKDIKSLEKTRKGILEEKEKSDQIYESYQAFSTQISNLETKKVTLLENSLQYEKQNLQQLKDKQVRLNEIEGQKENYFSLLQKKENLSEAKENFLARHRMDQQVVEAKVNIEQYREVLSHSTERLQTFNDIETSLSLLEKERNESEEVLSQLRDHTKEINTRLNMMKSTYQEIVKDQNSLKELGEEVPCPTCKRPLGDHLENQLSYLENRRLEIINETAKMKLIYDELVEKGQAKVQSLDKIKKEYNNLQVQLREKSGVENQLTNAKQQIQKLSTNIQELEEQKNQYPISVEFNPEDYKALLDEIQLLTPIYEEIIQLQNQVQEIEKTEAKIKNMEEDVQLIDKELESLTNKQVALNFNKETYTSLSQSLEDAQKVLDEVRENRYLVKSKLDKLTVNMEAVQNEIKQHEEIQLTLKDKQQEIIDLAKLDELFKAYKQDTLAQLAPKISEKMSYMIDAATDGLFSLVELDENYNIFIYHNGEKHPLEIFSGGEQKLAALLQRIAVSQLLVEQTSQASFDMIALDEVTSAFDEMRQDAMLEMLRSLNSSFRQILLVSHNSHIKDSFDHTLLVERGPNNKSTAKWALLENGKPSFDIEEVQNFVRENFEIDEEEKEVE